MVFIAVSLLPNSIYPFPGVRIILLRLSADSCAFHVPSHYQDRDPVMMCTLSLWSRYLHHIFYSPDLEVMTYKKKVQYQSFGFWVLLVHAILGPLWTNLTLFPHAFHRKDCEYMCIAFLLINEFPQQISMESQLTANIYWRKC